MKIDNNFLILYFKLQLKYFEPIWGDTKLSNSNAPILDGSKSKHKRTETITAPVHTSPIQLDLTLNTPPPIITKTTESATLCSSLDDNQNIDSQLDIENNVIQLEVKDGNIQIEIKDEDIQLELPWDSVDSSTNLKIKPLMEDMILPIVNVNILCFLTFLFVKNIIRTNIYTIYIINS